MGWTDRLYRSGQPFEMFAGHRVGVNWDPIGFHASEPGIGFEGLNLWGFRLNGLFAVLDDYNQTTDSYNIAGLQGAAAGGQLEPERAVRRQARWASEADQSGARYIIHPPKEFNTVYLVRFNGGVGFLPADVDGWAGVHALQTAGAAPQHVPAYEVNVNYALREDITVEAGYRDYPRSLIRPMRNEISRPIPSVPIGARLAATARSISRSIGL